MKRVYKLVAKVNKSTKATEKLIVKAGRKLIADCPTRWSSTYLMLSRLLLVRTQLSEVLDELQWDNLPISYWKQMENTVELLKPFACYTQLASSEETTSVSMLHGSRRYRVKSTYRANEPYPWSCAHSQHYATSIETSL